MNTVSDKPQRTKGALAWRLPLAGLLLLCALLASAAAGAWVQARYSQNGVGLPSEQAVASTAQARRDYDFIRGNVDAMAQKLGDLQAKIIEIDVISKRLAHVAGVSYTDPEVQVALEETSRAVADYITGTRRLGLRAEPADLMTRLLIADDNLDAILDGDSLDMADGDLPDPEYASLAVNIDQQSDAALESVPASVLMQLKKTPAVFDGVFGSAGARTIPDAKQQIASLSTRPATVTALRLGQHLDMLEAQVQGQKDRYSMLDMVLTRRAGVEAGLPTLMPVNYPYTSSSYGWRRHPISGRHIMHEGLDFAAPRGTPIYAASGGVITVAGFKRGYGNMVEISHGNDLVTRYAHAASVLVKVGDIVEKGQEIAKVGSTGQSTGPHLHFEVRVGGHPLDPTLFLAQPDKPSALVADASKHAKTR